MGSMKTRLWLPFQWCNTYVVINYVIDDDVIIITTGDSALLQDLDATVRLLLSRERDTNTTQAIRSAVLELDRIQVAMETVRVNIVKHHNDIIPTVNEADVLWGGSDRPTEGDRREAALSVGGEGEGERGSHHGCGEERQKLSSHSEGCATSQENQRFFFLLHIASSPSLSSYKQYCFNHFIVISFPILNKMDIFYSMFWLHS